MDHMQDEISVWAEKTFPHHNKQSIALHLLEEAVELCLAAGVNDVITMKDVLYRTVEAAFYKNQPLSVSEETSDVLILALTMAGHEGFDVQECVADKHRINLNRKWREPNDYGVAHHVD